MCKCITKFILIIIITIIISLPVLPQEDGGIVKSEVDQQTISAEIGTGFVSRYVWRGILLGNSVDPHIQPYGSVELNTSLGLLTFGLTGSYEINGDYSEVDLTFEYTHVTQIGNLTFALYDYFYPGQDVSFFNFKGKGEGAHIIEAGILFEGNEFIPFSLLVASNVYNDIPGENSIYIEGGYTFSLNELSFKIFTGAARGISSYYEVDSNGFEIINIGLSAEKEVEVSENFGIGLGLSYIINPYQKTNYLIFSLSI